MYLKDVIVLKIQSKNLFSTLVILVLLSGCTSTNVFKETGFLKNYEGFVESEQFDHTKVYRAKGIDKSALTQVKEIYVQPFEMWITPRPDAHFNYQQLVEISAYFHQSMLTRLRENNYEIVDKITSDTLTIRGAFSGIRLEAPELEVTDFIPFRVVLNAGNAAYLQVTDSKDVITKVSIELEFLKGKEQERIFAVMTSKFVDATVANNGSDNMKVVKMLLDNWVDRFVERLVSIKAEDSNLPSN